MLDTGTQVREMAYSQRDHLFAISTGKNVRLYDGSDWSLLYETQRGSLVREIVSFSDIDLYLKYSQGDDIVVYDYQSDEEWQFTVQGHGKMTFVNGILAGYTGSSKVAAFDAKGTFLGSK